MPARGGRGLDPRSEAGGSCRGPRPSRSREVQTCVHQISVCMEGCGGRRQGGWRQQVVSLAPRAYNYVHHAWPQALLSDRLTWADTGRKVGSGLAVSARHTLTHLDAEAVVSADRGGGRQGVGRRGQGLQA